MNKLGEKIKEIRLKKGLSQEAFAKVLGYNSRSTINKIEKGINEISYDKLVLLIKKFEVEIDELFDRNHNESFSPLDEDSILYVSFSARSDGNCKDVANYLLRENDKLILFKDIFYNPCSKCNYECFNSICKYRYDDVYDLFASANDYMKIVFVVPMYCGNPSSLFFIISERMQDYFSHNEEKWNSFVKKLHFICIYGSDKETPYFIETFKNIIKDESKILKIERHKYNLKMDKRVIEKADVINFLNDYKTRVLMGRK